MFIALQQEAWSGNYEKGRSMNDLEKAIETAKGWADDKHTGCVMLDGTAIWHSYTHGNQEPHPTEKPEETEEPENSE